MSNKALSLVLPKPANLVMCFSAVCGAETSAKRLHGSEAEYDISHDLPQAAQSTNTAPPKEDNDNNVHMQ